MASTAIYIKTGQLFRVALTGMAPATVTFASAEDNPSSWVTTVSATYTAHAAGTYTVTNATIYLMNIQDVMDRREATVAFTRDVSGRVLTEAWTLDSAIYTKTFTRDGSGYITSESAWVPS